LQEPPKFTQIGIFRLKIYHLATLVWRYTFCQKICDLFFTEGENVLLFWGYVEAVNSGYAYCGITEIFDLCPGQRPWHEKNCAILLTLYSIKEGGSSVTRLGVILPFIFSHHLKKIVTQTVNFSTLRGKISND
jgi:hypothetical protein